MKFLYKLLIGLAALLLLLVVLAFGCVYLLESFGPGIAAGRIQAMTGFRLDMSSLRLSLIHSSVEVNDLHLRNPEGWPEEDFVTVNQARVAVEPLTFVGDRRCVIDEMVLDLGPINLVTDKDGHNNATTFEDKLAGGSDKVDEKKPDKPSQGYLIKRLVLKTTSLRTVSYGPLGVTPVTIPLKTNIELHDVTDLGAVRKKLLSPFHKTFLNKMLKSVQWNSGSSGSDDR